MMVQSNAIRWPWLLAIIALHGILFLSWQVTTGHQAAPYQTDFLQLTFIKPIVFKAQSAAPIANKAIRVQAAAKPILLTEIVPPKLPDKLALEVLSSVENTVDKPSATLNLDVRKIDKELAFERSAHVVRAQFSAKLAKDSWISFEQKVAAAAVPRETTTQEIILQNGSRVTKTTHKGGGTSCVFHGNPSGGLNIIQREIVARTMSCGNL